MSWEPILEGPLADTARNAIVDIASALAAGDSEDRSSSDLALFWAYVTELDEARFGGQVEESVAMASAQLELGIASIALYGGLAGTGFAIAHVNDQDDAAEVLDAIDDRLLALLGEVHWSEPYDLIGGLVGFGVYFLERLASSRRDRARAALDRIVDHLVATSELTPEGTTWRTAPAELVLWQREVAPFGYYNCGVAHGVPGIIALLGRIAALPDAPPRVGALCDDATRWLLAQRQPSHPHGRFPGWVALERPTPPRTRAAWCYGDPGIAAALWNAAARRGTSVVDANDLARDVAVRPDETCGVRDAGLCHGAAGLGHLMNRCYQTTRDPIFRDAARRWFARALAMRQPDGFAGFVAIVGAPDNPTTRPAAGLLEGAMGIGLALMAALSSTEPAWDRMFLSDLPVLDRPGGGTTLA